MKVKVKESKRQNIWQQTKHTKQYPNLLQASKREPVKLLVLGRGDLDFCKRGTPFVMWRIEKEEGEGGSGEEKQEIGDNNQDWDKLINRMTREGGTTLIIYNHCFEQ